MKHICPKLSINGVNGDKIQLKKLFLTKIERKKACAVSLVTTHVHLSAYVHKCFIILLTTIFYMVQNTLSSYLPPASIAFFPQQISLAAGWKRYSLLDLSR